jgi:hypothetical protein
MARAREIQKPKRGQLQSYECSGGFGKYDPLAVSVSPPVTFLARTRNLK